MTHTTPRLMTTEEYAAFLKDAGRATAAFRTAHEQYKYSVDKINASEFLAANQFHKEVQRIFDEAIDRLIALGKDIA
jgi:hypothetical protein